MNAIATSERLVGFATGAVVVGGLIADDVTGVGVADDLAILALRDVPQGIWKQR